jgi:hypothetical protein
MVQFRENMHKHLTRHAVTATFVRASLPAVMTRMSDVAILVCWRKEAAP